MKRTRSILIATTVAVLFMAIGATGSWWWFEERNQLSAQERAECDKAREWVNDWVEPRRLHNFYEDFSQNEWDEQGRFIDQMSAVIDMRWKLCHP